MLKSLALVSLVAQIAAKGFGVYKDPGHYYGTHSFAGLRFVAEDPPHTLKMIGLDEPDGKWWSVVGKCEDGPAGPMTKMTFDFSPKGGPVMTGTYTVSVEGTKLVWPDGNAWKLIKTPPARVNTQANVLNSPNWFTLTAIIFLCFCIGGAVASYFLLRVTGILAGGMPAAWAGPSILGNYVSGPFVNYQADLAEEKKIKGARADNGADEAAIIGDGGVPKLALPSNRWMGAAFVFILAAAMVMAQLLLLVTPDRPLFETLYDPDRGIYKGTTMVPLKPKSHVFTHGFDTEVPAEYSIFQQNLPIAKGEQTHEIYFDEWTMTAFVTVVTSSRLIQIPFDEDGRLADHIREWTVGDPGDGKDTTTAGLHNVAHSDCYPGHLWISTETDDRVYLVNSRDGFSIKYTLHVPTRLVKKDGSVHVIGGPHSVREGPNCDVWAMLKGSNTDGPQYDDPKHAEYYKEMQAQHFKAEGEPVPDSWAVWKVDPEKYNFTKAPARGGVLFEALESPTMATFDGVGNAWITQDRVNRILHVDTKGVATQVSLPSMVMDVEAGQVWSFENGNGPGVSTAPDGSVWLANLGSPKPWLVRFKPGSTDPLIFKDLLSGGVATEHTDFNLRTIHIAFSTKGGTSGKANVMYVLTSSLLDPHGTEAVIVQEFDKDWNEPITSGGEVNYQKIVLPSTNSAAHRLAVAENIRPRSILVTGLLTNVVYQITGRSI